MFSPSREEARRFLVDAWTKVRTGAPASALEQQAAGLVALHPEYHALLEDPERHIERDYVPEGGAVNPFLHLSLHLAVAEQLVIDQPPGIRAEFERIRAARGDYATALDYWQKALAARESAGDAPRTRVAKWTVARGLRSIGRLDDAERIQRALAIETEAAGAPDGFIYEELAEIALARNDPAGAKPWAAKAYALLKEDIWLKANEASRLTRLADVGGVATR